VRVRLRLRARAGGRGARPLRGCEGAGAGTAGSDPPTPTPPGEKEGVGWGGRGEGWAPGGGERGDVRGEVEEEGRWRVERGRGGGAGPGGPSAPGRQGLAGYPAIPAARPAPARAPVGPTRDGAAPPPGSTAACGRRMGGRSLSHRPCPCEGLGGGAWRMREEACACHARPVAGARSRPLYLSPVPCAAHVADAIPMLQHRPCCRACLKIVSAFDFPASVKSAIG
jgi:hypothetical protein